MEFSRVIKERYACKKFDGQRVKKEQLEAILEAGLWHRQQKICKNKKFMWFRRKKAWLNLIK